MECQPARMKKDVQNLILWINDFDANQFDERVPELCLLQSGVIASPEVLEDLRNAFEEGKNQSNDILEKRVFSKELYFITKSKRINPGITPINVTKACSNAVEMERNVLVIVDYLAEKNDAISLELVLVKRISKECLTIFNIDGFMIKTAKGKLLQSFYRQPLLEVLSVYFSLVDMRLIWRLASPTSDDCDAMTNSGIDYLWRDYLNRVFSMVYSRRNNATTIILIFLGGHLYNC